MDYSQKLITRAFSDTWNLVFDRSFLSAVIALSILFGTFWFLRCRKEHDEAKRALKDFGIAALITGLTFLAVFLLNVLIFTPAALYREEHAAKSAAESALDVSKNAKPATTPVQVEVRQHGVDEEGRKQLAAANKTIETLQSELAEARKEAQSARTEAAAAMLAAKPPLQKRIRDCLDSIDSRIVDPSKLPRVVTGDIDFKKVEELQKLAKEPGAARYLRIHSVREGGGVSSLGTRLSGFDHVEFYVEKAIVED